MDSSDYFVSRNFVYTPLLLLVALLPTGARILAVVRSVENAAVI